MVGRWTPTPADSIQPGARDRPHLLRRRLRRHRKRDGVRAPVEQSGTDRRRGGGTVQLALRAERDQAHPSRSVRGADDRARPGIAIHVAGDRGDPLGQQAAVDARDRLEPPGPHQARDRRPQAVQRTLAPGATRARCARSGSRAGGRRGRSAAWRRSASTSDHARRSSRPRRRRPAASGRRGRGRRSSCPAGPDRRRRPAAQPRGGARRRRAHRRRAPRAATTACTDRDSARRSHRKRPLDAVRRSSGRALHDRGRAPRSTAFSAHGTAATAGLAQKVITSYPSATRPRRLGWPLWSRNSGNCCCSSCSRTPNAPAQK